MTEYVVDSELGNDCGVGCVHMPYKTLAALPPLTDGDIVTLLRGSTWHETFTITAPNITVRSGDGDGDLPIIDCSDELSSDGWTDSAGRGDSYSNVYSRTITTNTDGVKTWVNLWEDGAFLSIAPSVAACQSTAGSCFVNNPLSTTPIVYIHPKMDGNPASNGKIYSASVRRYAIDAGSAENCQVVGLQTQCNLCENGSIIIGRGGMVDECVIRQGSKHAILLRDGCTLQNSHVYDALYKGNANLIVFNENSPAGLGISILNNVISNASFDPLQGGILCHPNIDGNFGLLTVTGNTFVNLNVAIAEEAITAAIITDNIGTENRFWLRMGVACPYTLENNVVTTLTVPNSCIISNGVPGASLQITGDVYYAANPQSGLIALLNRQISITLENVTLVGTHVSAVAGCIFVNTGAGEVSLAMNHSKLSADGGNLIRALTPLASYIGDDNCYSKAGAFNCKEGATTYPTLAAWQAHKVGQDMRSQVGTCP